MNIEYALKDWIPFRLRDEKIKPICEWLYLANKQFTEPFFDETISKCRSLKENSQPYRVVTSLEVLGEWATSFPSIPPKAIIFHVSRCGSTLLSQLLAQINDTIALSEVPFFDDLLRWGFRNNALPDILPVLKNAVSFYGKKRNSERNLYIKTDSWHIHFYKEYRQLYPDVPIILLYRRPDEVIQSHKKLRGMHAVQGVVEPLLFGFDESVFNLSLDVYTATVLETYYTAFLDIIQKDNLAFAFDYKEGIISIIQQIMRIGKIELSDTELKLMHERSSRHSKFPGKQFAEPPLTEIVTPAYMTRAFELYNKLEKLSTHPPTYGKD